MNCIAKGISRKDFWSQPSVAQSLIGKVQDVADTFMQTVLAAGNTTGRDMNDPAMNVLMKKATNLASVLTTLMRSLRVFN